MPTATTTTVLTEAASDPTPSSPKANGSASSRSTVATLRSLYPRAATAFLHRNVALTHSLLTSAFSLLHQPESTSDDGLTTHRKKWDILRVTFETTVYASPPETQVPEAFPASLRANLMLSPQSLVMTLHTRSLALFTPSLYGQKPNAAFLPIPLLVTLILASVKLECPEVGRGIIEDWLARRNPSTSTEDVNGYSKILELYCLQVLPRLQEWNYASDFLQYERELPQETRNQLLSSLDKLHQDAIATQRPPSPIASPTITPCSASSSRSVSPSLSVSASSESSNLTHTATPRSPRPNVARPNGKDRARIPAMTRLTPSPSPSTSSQSISSIATSKTITPASVRRSKHKENGKAHQVSSQNSKEPSSSETPTPVPRGPRSQSLQPTSTRSPTTMAIIRSYLDVSFFQASKSKFITLFAIFVLFPILSFLFRLRRRRMTGVSSGAAEEVRRRLRAVEGKSAFAKVWEEAVRAIVDTVSMGGRGLV